MRPDTTAMAALLLALLLCLPACVDDNQDRYDEAEKLWLDENYEAAVSKLTVVVEQAKSGDLKARGLFRLGEIHYLNLEEPDKAIGFFSQAAEISGDVTLDLEANNYIADIYRNALANYDLAILQYQRILHEYPGLIDEASYRYKIAQSYFAKGNYPQAIIEFQELLDRNPESELVPDALYQIANCKFIAGQAEEALALFTALLKRFPDGKYEYDVHLGIAILFEEQDRLKEALAAYETMAKKWPDKELIARKIDSVRKRIDKKVTR
jgi:tetratricopeptide (TPR) repeat protein